VASCSARVESADSACADSAGAGATGRAAAGGMGSLRIVQKLQLEGHDCCMYGLFASHSPVLAQCLHEGFRSQHSGRAGLGSSLVPMDSAVDTDVLSCACTASDVTSADGHALRLSTMSTMMDAMKLSDLHGAGCCFGVHRGSTSASFGLRLSTSGRLNRRMHFDIL